MIGGKVVEVRREPGDVARIWVSDSTHSTDDELAIWVFNEVELPAPGDTVWWQGRAAMWTDAARTFEDRRLQRVGHSFDPRRNPYTYVETVERTRREDAQQDAEMAAADREAERILAMPEDELRAHVEAQWLNWEAEAAKAEAAIQKAIAAHEQERADRLDVQVDELRSLLSEFIELHEEPWWQDQRGFCQADFVETDRLVERTRAALAEGQP